MSVESRKNALADRLSALQLRCDKLRKRCGDTRQRIMTGAGGDGLQTTDREMLLLEHMMFAVETAMESPEATMTVLEDNLNRLGV